MDTTLTLDEPHFRAAFDKARASGQTPAEYVQRLIDADGRTFDEILKPVRDGFASKGEDELDPLLDETLAAARHPK